MADPVIQTYKLRKEYGSQIAVSDLTITVDKGEVFGFLGPNGAGKTTSVNMLLGLTKQTFGDGVILGKPLGDPQVRRFIGFLPEHFRFHSWLTGTEFLKLHGALYGLSRNEIDKKSIELLDLVELTDHQKKKLKTYSKGMLQRIGLAQALLSDPELIVLDEPTSGLDPLGRRLFRDIIRYLKSRDKTIFINSHMLSEIEVVCDRVAFINNGVVIKISHLTEVMQGKFSVEIQAKNFDQELLIGLANYGREIFHSPKNEGFSEIKISLEDEKEIPKINFFLVENGVDIYSIKKQPETLEDLFLRVVEQKD